MTDWYAPFYDADDSAENPHGQSIYGERRRNEALHEHLSRGGRMADFPREPAVIHNFNFEGAKS